MGFFSRLKQAATSIVERVSSTVASLNAAVTQTLRGDPAPPPPPAPRQTSTTPTPKQHPEPPPIVQTILDDLASDDDDDAENESDWYDEDDALPGADDLEFEQAITAMRAVDVPEDVLQALTDLYDDLDGDLDEEVSATVDADDSIDTGDAS